MSKDHAALETAKAQLAVLEALGPVKLPEASGEAFGRRHSQHPHPNAELAARLRTTILAMEVEALLREAGKRAAERYAARRQAGKVTG